MNSITLLCNLNNRRSIKNTTTIRELMSSAMLLCFPQLLLIHVNATIREVMNSSILLCLVGNCKSVKNPTNRKLMTSHVLMFFNRN